MCGFLFGQSSWGDSFNYFMLIGKFPDLKMIKKIKRIVHRKKNEPHITANLFLQRLQRTINFKEHTNIVYCIEILTIGRCEHGTAASRSIFKSMMYTHHSEFTQIIILKRINKFIAAKSLRRIHTLIDINAILIGFQFLFNWLKKACLRYKVVTKITNPPNNCVRAHTTEILCSSLVRI